MWLQDEEVFDVTVNYCRLLYLGDRATCLSSMDETLFFRKVGLGGKHSYCFIIEVTPSSIVLIKLHG